MAAGLKLDHSSQQHANMQKKKLKVFIEKQISRQVLRLI